MRTLFANEIKGNWTSLFLKIDENDDIDYFALEELIDYYIFNKMDGIYSNGTACEFYSQSFDEYIKINDMLAKKCEVANMPFQIGASHMDPIQSLARVKYAASLKPSAIQVILPDWFPTNRRTQVSFLKKAVEVANGIGIVIYNPPHAKFVLKPGDYKDILSKVDGIVGIKTAGGDDNWYDEMKDVFEKVSVFIPGHFLATGISKGAQGAYSNVAAINPIAAQKWYEMTKTDMGSALELQTRIVKFMDEQIAPFITKEEYPNHACDKFMAVMGGWCDMTTRLRWPYIGIDEDRINKVKEYGMEIIPELFDF